MNLTPRERELIRETLNECAGGLTCRHSIPERREMADLVRAKFSPADEPEELCPGCLGRGTGEYCVLCSCRIPASLRRKPGSPSEIPAPGKVGQCRCLVPIPHSPVDHEAAKREHSERLAYLARRAAAQAITRAQAIALGCMFVRADDGSIWATCPDGTSCKVEG